MTLTLCRSCAAPVCPAGLDSPPLPYLQALPYGGGPLRCLALRRMYRLGPQHTQELGRLTALTQLQLAADWWVVGCGTDGRQGLERIGGWCIIRIFEALFAAAAGGGLVGGGGSRGQTSMRCTGPVWRFVGQSLGEQVWGAAEHGYVALLEVEVKK